ncbi:hypothetical protein M0E87_11605 [Corynebacterium sp. CCM 9185]|uniref:DUF6779 domain-containing protein n=1 Tax=Corynebacterium marambiense TaxID=2765364 RepID=A0ABS0W084_9CORY|nr:DUF6779 domain-containing protein [Corynebacterium marambiense]MBI9001053.1 hypothetical protein [Corynebacterium marambiense]MCK7664294.1 hypothetical protein [Corynebacterium marambiense]
MSDADENATASGTGPEQGGEQNDNWQATLVVLVVLALIAVVVMLFTGSDVALKIGVVAALWAAVLGIILVARYRRQVAAEQRERELVERSHEEELRREFAAHREQERILEQSYLESLDEYRDTALAEIREQLAAMRAQLEELSGQTWSYEPAALQAEARRIQELLAGPGRAPTDVDRSVFARADSVDPEGRIHAEDTGVPGDLNGSDPRDVQDVEEVVPVEPTPIATSDRPSGRRTADDAEPLSPEPDEGERAERPTAWLADAASDSTDGGAVVDSGDDEDTTGAFAPVSTPSWLTSPSAMKPNPLITGGDVPGGGVPTDAGYLITGGPRSGKLDPTPAVTETEDSAPHHASGEGTPKHGAHEGNGFDTGAMAAVPWDASGRPASRRAAHATESTGSPEIRSDDTRDVEVPRRGRRRRDERGGGISVAELLENLRENADDDQ